MKHSSSIAKIVIWSVIAISLIILMIIMSLSDNFLNSFMDFVGGNDKNLKVIKTTEVDLSNIKNISVDITSGSVNIASYNEDKISVEEKANRDIDESELLDIYQDGDTLYIKQPVSITIFNLFGFINRREAKYVKLPKIIYDEIKLKATSGNLKFEDVETNNLTLKMTSGNASASEITAHELNVNMTSGNAEIEGAFSKVTTTMTSGNIQIDNSIAPLSLIVDITSGNATFAIPDNEGFALSEQKTSGTFINEFKLNDFNEYRNAKNKYRIKMTNGIVRLEKNN